MTSRLRRLIFFVQPWLDVVRRARGHDTCRDWLEWALAYAAPHGLQWEVESDFWHFLKSGDHPSIAAQAALWEWDI